MPKTFNLKFIKREKLTNHTYSFYFQRPKNFNFKAGQYLRMTLPHENADPKGISRFFTISSSPDETDLMVTVKILNSSFKKALFNLKLNNKAQFFGPIGFLTLGNNKDEDLFFISGGMGITPFKSMISYAFFNQLSKNITLLAAFSSPDDFIFYKELKKISAESKRINIKFFVTDEKHINKWEGEKGKFTIDVIRKYAVNLYSNKFYISGPSAFVESVLQILKKLNVEDSKIYIEEFTGY